MSNNVRCTGRRYDDPAHPDRYQLTDCAIGPGPRPWKGERGRAIPDGWWKHPTERVNYLTRKPCPRCGGQVELIPQDGES